MVKPDKQLVRQRFAKSLPTYGENSPVQRAMARRVLELALEHGGTEYPSALEIGAGSGGLTALLASELKVGQLWLNDIVGECKSLEKAFPGAVFVQGDAETCEGLPTGLDLIASNATFQWFHHTQGAIQRFATLLKPGGLLVFSTFGPKNLREIAALTGVGLQSPPLEDLAEMAGSSLEVEYMEEGTTRLEFPGPDEVLSHLKLTGVTGLAKRRWTRAGLERFRAGYAERFASPHGVTLTYHPIYVVARKQ